MLKFGWKWTPGKSRRHGLAFGGLAPQTKLQFEL